MYQGDQHRCSTTNGVQVSNGSNNNKEDDLNSSSIASTQIKALRCLDDAYIVQPI